MRFTATLALVTTTVTCSALLVACGLAWAPHGLGLVACPVLLLIATYVSFAVIRSRSRSEDEPAKTRARVARRSAVACGAVALGTLLFLAFDIPVRVAFVVWRADFDRAADRFTPEAATALFGERIGPYRIDAVALDERGGLYLRVHEAQGLLEMYSYGFARGANARGTPFGNAGYSLTGLGGDWSWFVVNDDW